MNARERETVEAWIRHHDENRASHYELAAAVERLGDSAFGYLVERLRSRELPPRHRINALRGLFRVVRHDWSRASECLAVILESFQDDDKDVRSRAVSLSIGVMHVIERSGKPVGPPFVGKPVTEVRRILMDSLLAAEKRGIGDVSSGHIKEFLADVDSTDSTTLDP